MVSSLRGLVDRRETCVCKSSSILLTYLIASAGTLNNTVIANTKPTKAEFTTAKVQQSPTTGTAIANKKYVDSRATALAIALGS